MKIEIKRATPTDVKLISQLGAQTFKQTFVGTCTDQDLTGVLQEYYNEEQVTKELNDPDDYFFVLFHEGDVAGYARINLGDQTVQHFTNKRSAELKRIYFLQAFQGKGLAKELLQYCFGFLQEQNYQQVYLSVWEHNERAQAFYRKHGFVNTKIENPFPLGQTPQMDYWFLKQL